MIVRMSLPLLGVLAMDNSFFAELKLSEWGGFFGASFARQLTASQVLARNKT